MTFTPQEIEDLKRDGWEWAKSEERWERKTGLSNFKYIMAIHDGRINVCFHSTDTNPHYESFSTLQELREFFGLGVEG